MGKPGVGHQLASNHSDEDGASTGSHGPAPTKALGWVFNIAAFAYAAYYIRSEISGPLPGLEHRVVIVTGALALALLAYPPARSGRTMKLVNLATIVAVLATGVYAFRQFDGLTDRVGLGATTADIWFGTITFLALLLAAKRTIGWDFPIVTLVFIGYCFAGPWLPSVLHHNGFGYADFIDAFFLSSHGPYGSLTSLASYIVLFVIFSAFMQASGMTEWITAVAGRLLGKTRGGAAKISVVGSSATGAITGVSTANVAAVGSITIPMMMKSGYTKENAAAIEASSGMGAQIMPPLMGAAIFVMVEFVGMSYWSIASAALLVGILFYFSLFITVDLQAVKQGGSRLLEDDGPTEPLGRLLLRGLHHLIAPAVLLYGLAILGVSPGRAGLYALTVAAVVYMTTHFSRTVLLDAAKVVIQGIQMGLPMLAVLAAASLMSGIVVTTGVGVELSSSAVDMANGSVFVLLVLAAACSLLLGLGAPSLVSYSVVAVLVAPALTDGGVDLLAAHLFVFYFAVLSVISPPTAPDPFVAASISGASPMRVAFRCMRVGAILFILPFVIVYKPALLLDAPAPVVALEFVLAAVAVYCWAAAFEGIALPSTPINLPVRLVIFALGVATLIAPTVGALVSCAGVAALHLVLHQRKNRSEPQTLATSSAPTAND